jgi:trehalose 2-sulfotransferase
MPAKLAEVREVAVERSWGNPFTPQCAKQAVTANGVFGSKLMWDQVDAVRTQFAKVLELGDAAPSAVFAAAFPNLRYIWLARRDKLRQGISF